MPSGLASAFKAAASLILPHHVLHCTFARQVSTSSEALSGVYAVLGRRRSRILREEMREGSDLFIGEPPCNAVGTKRCSAPGSSRVDGHQILCDCTV